MPSRNLHIVILAGGSGTRFWPASRTSRPKQLIPLVGGDSMLVRTIERVLPLSPALVTIVTHTRQLEETLRQVAPFAKTVPVECIAEPVGRNTAAAIAVAAARSAAIDPEAVMVVLPADHYIRDAAGLRQALKEGIAVANGGALVTLGITPTYPETGYGYIRSSGDPDCHGSYSVERFVEKPDAETAAAYLLSGDYVWNSGMFIWTVPAIRAALLAHMPGLSHAINSLPAESPKQLSEALVGCYAQLESRSIDHGVMEYADQVRVIPVTVGWSDMGSWSALPELVAADQEGNHIDGPSTCVTIDSRDCIVAGGTVAVGLIGVNNLIVVSTDDALLVCERSRAQDVKKVVEQLQQQGKYEYTD